MLPLWCLRKHSFSWKSLPSLLESNSNGDMKLWRIKNHGGRVMMLRSWLQRENLPFLLLFSSFFLKLRKKTLVYIYKDERFSPVRVRIWTVPKGGTTRPLAMTTTPIEMDVSLSHNNLCGWASSFSIYARIMYSCLRCVLFPPFHVGGWFVLWIGVGWREAQELGNPRHQKEGFVQIKSSSYIRFGPL